MSFQFRRYGSANEQVMVTVRFGDVHCGQLIFPNKPASDEFLAHFRAESACDGSELPEAEYPTGSAIGTAA